jgi:hypothetical protein
MIKQVHHSLTCDGTDVELTRFLEYIDQTWRDEYLTLFNFSDMNWDNGHDVLRFVTNSGKVNIVKYIQKLSEKFPTMFFMYDFYTAEHDGEHEEGVFWLYEGKLNTSKEELFNEE